MVVSKSSVSFYRNIELLSSVDLPRPVTDCFNSGEGLLVGDKGMEISQLRYLTLPFSLYLSNHAFTELVRFHQLQRLQTKNNDAVFCAILTFYR